jgi:hypothetical protein
MLVYIVFVLVGEAYDRHLLMPSRDIRGKLRFFSLLLILSLKCRFLTIRIGVEVADQWTDVFQAAIRVAPANLSLPSCCKQNPPSRIVSGHI